MKLKMDFSANKMIWDDCHVPMRQYPALQKVSKKTGTFVISPAESLFLDVLEEDLEDDDTLPTCDMTECSDDEYSLNDEIPEDSDMGNDHAVDTYHDDDEMSPIQGITKVKEIKSSLYEKPDIHKVVAGCTHLAQERQNELLEVLDKYPKLFSNKLGTYTDELIHLDIDTSVPPTATRAYTVPHNHKSVFKAELDRLVKIGILEEGGRSEWISGTFIIPKKLLPGEDTPRVRWISDFRALNKALKRKVYPIPRIADILARRTGYSFLSKLDLSMQYYTFELDDESKELCTIATPFGLYRYRKLPMGVSVAPDIAQEIMEKTLKDIEDLEVYIDDIALFSNDWESHLAGLDKIFSRLEEKGFMINPLKCEFAVKESDFLGHWLTPCGIKPLRKKVSAILAMQPPNDLSTLRSFLGLVQYYRDMWPRRSHILAPLTDLIGTKIYRWDQVHQKAFDKMKALVAADALLAYPDHNKPFHIETDASDYQLGGCIKQDGRVVAYYSRKLNSAQKNYTTIEKELLSIVEIFKEFRSMLLGAEIHVHTDHKNLTYNLTQYTTQRVLRWRLIFEEYGAKFHYKPGKINFIADAISRVPTTRTERKSRETFLSEDSKWDPYFDSWDGIYCMIQRDPELAECFLEHPEFDDEGRFPFQFETLEAYQKKSTALQSLPTTNPDRFHVIEHGTAKLICFRQNGEDKIVLTQELLPKVVKYYHEAMAHVEGMSRLAQTIKQHYHHVKIDEEVQRQLKACDICSKSKRGGKVYGESAPRDALVMPWQEVHCDSIGPWKIELRARELTFHAMTMIDPSTNLVEIAHTLTTTGSENAAAVENNWIARYPRPVKIVTDQGPEFSVEFTDMCKKNGIYHSTSTSRNPQGNSLIERIHQTIGQVLRAVVTTKNPKSVHEGKAVIEETLATAMHACRCACTSSLGYNSPGALAFHRDMFLDIPLIADIITLQKNRQALVDKRLLRVNAGRIKHDYAVGDQVWKRNYIGLSDKLKHTVVGPYPITRVHCNGTVTIRLSPHVQERINIRRIRPKFPLAPIQT